MSERTEIVDDVSTDPQSVQCQDEELEVLLNDALNDFGKKREKDFPPGVQSTEIPIDTSLLENLWNEPGMKEAMSRFETSIRSAFNSNSTNVSNENIAVGPIEGSLTGSSEDGAESGKNETSDNIDIDSIIDDFRKMTKLTAETFTKETDAELEANASDLFYEEMSKNIMNVARTISGTIINSEQPTNEDEEDNSFHSMVTQTIKSLSDNNKDLESYFNLNNCSEDLEEMLKGIDQKDKINTNFFKFVKICMRTIKLVVYPSLKDLCDKYPSFIETKGSSLTESEMESYKKQYEIIEKICKLFENEDTDSDKLNPDEDMDFRKPNSLYNRFTNVMNVMKEIQECGQIPKELREQSKFFDSSEVPDENVTSRYCSIS